MTPRLSAEQRRALELLAHHWHGINGELLIDGHGFSRRLLAGLMRRGLAAERLEMMMAGNVAVEVVRIRITAEGRRVLAAG